MINRVLKSLLGLLFILISSTALAAPKFLYLAPGDHTSRDGQFSLAAFDNGAGASPQYTYNYVRFEPSGLAVIVSDAVDEAFNTFPDIRGYGPVQTTWSQESGTGFNGFPRLTGALVATRHQSRKHSTISFLVRRMVNGQAYWAQSSFNGEKYDLMGIEAIKQKALGQGFSASTEFWTAGEFTDQTFVNINGDPNQWVEDLSNSFDLSDGRVIEISGTVDLITGGNFDTMKTATYDTIVKVTLDGAGDVHEEVLSSTINVPTP